MAVAQRFQSICRVKGFWPSLSDCESCKQNYKCGIWTLRIFVYSGYLFLSRISTWIRYSGRLATTCGISLAHVLGWSKSIGKPLFISIFMLLNYSTKFVESLFFAHLNWIERCRNQRVRRSHCFQFNTEHLRLSVVGQFNTWFYDYMVDDSYENGTYYDSYNAQMSGYWYLKCLKLS